MTKRQTKSSTKLTTQNNYFHVRVNEDFKKKVKLLSEFQDLTMSEIIRLSVDERFQSLKSTN
jgi:hypothetical protein